MDRMFKRAAYMLLGSPNCTLASSLWRLRSVNPAYVEFLRSLPPTGLLLDIGCGFGVATVIARRVRPDAGVAAFDPVPFNVSSAERLCWFLRIKNVAFTALALGQENCVAEMVTPVDSPEQSHLIGSDFNCAKLLLSGGALFTVNMVTIDSFPLPRVAGVRLNVGDYSEQVLRGAANLIARDHPAFFRVA
jgi:FkbM family methyltransferase